MRNHVSKWCLLRRQITKQTPSVVQSGSYYLQPPSPSCVRLWQKPTIVKRATGLKWHFGNPAVLLTGCCGGHYPEGTTLCSKGRQLHFTLCPVWHYLHPPPLLPQCETISQWCLPLSFSILFPWEVALWCLFLPWCFVLFGPNKWIPSNGGY